MAWSPRNFAISALIAVDRRLVRAGQSHRWYRKFLVRTTEWLCPKAKPLRSKKRPVRASGGPSIFDVSGGGGVRSRIDSRAAGFDGSSSTSAGQNGPLTSDAPKPRIDALRRAATINLFEEAGLDVVPAQMWPYLDRFRKIDEATRFFLHDIGVDEAAIRARNPDMLRRTNEILLLLLEAEGAFARLNPKAKQRLEQALFSGDLTRVRDAATIVATYEAIVRLLDHWSPAQRFVAFRDFAEVVGDALSDPLESTLADAEEARHISDRLSLAMARLDKARADVDDLATALDYAGYTLWAEASEIARDIAMTRRLLEEIADAVLTIDDVVRLLDEVDRKIAHLREHLRHGASRAGSGGSGSGSRHGASGGDRSSDSGRTADAGSKLSELDEALVFFDFKVGERPSWGQVTPRYKTKMLRAHPDRGGSTEEAQIVNYHRDVLRRHFKSA